MNQLLVTTILTVKQKEPQTFTIIYQVSAVPVLATVTPTWSLSADTHWHVEHVPPRVTPKCIYLPPLPSPPSPVHRSVQCMQVQGYGMNVYKWRWSGGKWMPSIIDLGATKTASTAAQWPLKKAADPSSSSSVFMMKLLEGPVGVMGFYPGLMMWLQLKVFLNVPANSQRHEWRQNSKGFHQF